MREFGKTTPTMRELIKNVAGVISDLQTLNMLKKDNIKTTIEQDGQTKKYMLTVSVIASEEILHLCLEMFQELRVSGHVMNVRNSISPSYSSILIVTFYEQ